ncbi:unnamed protein product [Pleuronectes platessa]|uniref:Uncharacterized protein n=1 Tax=Pleuronectes platessa TaxID=8262 RepID=A0A9N7TRR9_PLEPL|nr:unnamed protein product [Pleuronectes platessa]
MACRDGGVLRLHLVMRPGQQVDGSLAAGRLTEARLQEGGRHHFGQMVVKTMMMKGMVVMMKMEVAGLVHIVMLITQVVLREEPRGEVKGAARGEESELMVTRGRF